MVEFDEKVQKVLGEYHQRMLEEKNLMESLPFAEGMKRRDEFLLAVGEEVGRFLNSMVKGTQSKMILEVGTSYGYSTLWLAEAARATNGRVITLEIDSKKADYAKSRIAEAGLSSFVDFRVNDALVTLSEIQTTQPELQLDFVLIDIWKELYVPSFELFYPMLAPGAYIIGDNMIFPPSHKAEVNAYRDAIKSKKVFDSVLLPIGSGIEVSTLVSNA